MDFNKSLALIVTLSCLVLAGKAVPTTRILDLSPTTGILDLSSTTGILGLSPSGAPSSAPKDALINLQSKVAAQNVGADLLELCSDAENPKFCAESIAPHIRGALDPVFALEAEIGVTMDETKKISGVIASLIHKPGNSKDYADALDICKEQYEDIEDTIKETLDAIKQNDVYEAWMKFAAVISSQTTCEEAFKETPGASFPIADDSNTIFQLGGNCLAILQRLSQGQFLS